MKIFAREGLTLFATLTADEFNRIDAFREAFAELLEHRRTGVGPGSEIDLAAWFEAAEKVTGARASNEHWRDLFQRQVNALDEALVQTDAVEFDTVTVADWLKAIQGFAERCERLVTLRRHFESEIAKIDKRLDEIGPPELKVKT